ncbi:multiple sugar transport system permease protein [Devosia subaequoris]|uniref:Multiple sugar transport system permease protein n=1 Tax=Devosia subaequoris TaxID=395930 RepID=A0A7W6IM11_9HYPH|nr:sugar ABC transporter permease [Devosia subaequoris]MBB4052098.1 multiple sugar transport system permease protein [Devosia subaequoris]MCP1210261.1 sugar ABC transporter permease [Devosia subaequoris]
MSSIDAANGPVLTASETARSVREIPRNRTGSALKKADNRAAYMFLLPWFAGIILITALPMLASLYLSFTDYAVIGLPSFVGFDNYVRLFTSDRRFITSIWVTLKYVGFSVPLVLLFSLAVAVALNRGLRGLAIYRSLFYVPSLIGASVGIGLLWKEVFGERGVVNDILALFGVAGRGWINNPTFALPSVIALNVWTFGASMVIFLAALRQIPESYYEAASIDGANAWQRFRRITLPLITPVIFFNTVLLLINSFQSFTQAFVVSNGRGGPVDSTLLYSLYLYQQAFQQLQMGYASAMAWVLLIAIGLATALMFWSSRYWVFYGDR